VESFSLTSSAKKQACGHAGNLEASSSSSSPMRQLRTRLSERITQRIVKRLVPQYNQLQDGIEEDMSLTAVTHAQSDNWYADEEEKAVVTEVCWKLVEFQALPCISNC
jgi:hypothetical protein